MVSNYMLNLFVSIMVIAGALNWGVVGLSNINLVERIFGSSIAKVIYILVGLAGLLQLITLVII